MRVNKKSEIWVSAVLFIALGIVAISIILAAALPLIEKIKDKNTIIQTKGILLAIDDNVYTVANEGPGSQRQLSPLIIDKGELVIDEINDTIAWKMKTTAMLMEPNITIPEGNVNQRLDYTFVEDEYLITLWLEYENVNLTLDSKFSNPFKGKYSSLIKHTGYFDSNSNPVISIAMA